MIEKSVMLHCSAEEAFLLFTTRVSEWWPTTHRLTKDPKSELFMEPNGRFWERATDGREIDLGRLKEWQPPHRVVLDFYLGSSPAQPTAVEVTFMAEASGTRVTIHHRSKPESEGLWEQRAPAFEQNWATLLHSLASW